MHPERDVLRHTTPGGRVWTWEAFSVTPRGGYRCRVHIAGIGTQTVTVPGALGTIDQVVEQVDLAVDSRKLLPPPSAV